MRATLVYKAFREIQDGPNPLTPDEVRKMIDKRPEVYACLEPYATPRNLDRYAERK